jgi:hypothetical protein
MVPSTSRHEWLKLISDRETIHITSLSLKIKINKLKYKIRSGLLSEEAAIEELYLAFKNHYEIYKNDLHKIFPKDVLI